MPSRTCRVSYWAAMLGFALLVLLCTVTQIDLDLSARFYDPARGWYQGEAVPWGWLYRYGQYPAIVLAVGAFFVLLGGLWQPAWVRYRRICLLWILAVVLGPGLLINGILKPGWGRPRPGQVEQFGGGQSFRGWWQPGGTGSGRSFPSGHAAMGFVLVAGAVLMPPRHPWLRLLATTTALLYGSLMGWARIVQGGHFLSDVIWSGGLICCLVVLLHATLPGLRPSPPGTAW